MKATDLFYGRDGILKLITNCITYFAVTANQPMSSEEGSLYITATV